MIYRTHGTDGFSVSVIGFGALALGNVFPEVSPSGDASLVGQAVIPVWHPAPSSVRTAAAQVIAACRKRNVDAASLAIWTCLRNTKAATTLVGLSNGSELGSSCAALTLQLDDELLSEIHDIIAPRA